MKSSPLTRQSIEYLVCEVYKQVFGDQFQTMPIRLMNLFKGELRGTYDSRTFLQSQDEQAVLVRFLIFSAGRLAFHYTLEQFVMGEFELSENLVFEAEVHQIDKDWFLGSEEFLWNAAIQRTLPNLERLIRNKDGQYFAHRLKFGQN